MQAFCLQTPTLKIQLKMDFMEIFRKSQQNRYFTDVSGRKGFLSRLLSLNPQNQQTFAAPVLPTGALHTERILWEVVGHLCGCPGDNLTFPTWAEGVRLLVASTWHRRSPGEHWSRVDSVHCSTSHVTLGQVLHLSGPLLWVGLRIR